jgi:hypothetical protein
MGSDCQRTGKSEALYSPDLVVEVMVSLFNSPASTLWFLMVSKDAVWLPA